MSAHEHEATPEVAAPAPAAMTALPAASAAGTLGASILQLQRQAGNRAASRVAHAHTRALARYEIEGGSLGINNPVHETLTLIAVRRAREAAARQPGHVMSPLLAGVDTSGIPAMSSSSGHNLSAAEQHRSLHQFIRGVMWADDPLGLLFDSEASVIAPSTGLQWYWNFDPQYATDRANLEARSHYGDLQFFHGMASADNEAAAVTRTHVLEWARFLLDVGTARISGDTRLDSLPLTARLFETRSGADWTIKRLFGSRRASGAEVRQRAVGVLFHLIQDSHARGHVERDPATSRIREFHSYSHQGHDEHGAADTWGPGATLEEHVRNTPGASLAVERCVEVLTRLENGQSTDEIMAWLDSDVFALAPDVRAAGPGAEFVPPPPPPRHEGLTQIERHH